MRNQDMRERFCPFIAALCVGKTCMAVIQPVSHKDDYYCKKCREVV